MRVRFHPDLIRSRKTPHQEFDLAPSQVIDTVVTADWSRFPQFFVTRPDGLELEVSGSHSDGFAVAYAEAGSLYFISQPVTLQDIGTLVALFVAGGNEWRQRYAFKYAQPVEPEGRSSWPPLAAACVLLLAFGSLVCWLAMLLYQRLGWVR